MSRAKFALGVPVAMAADLVLFTLIRHARPRPFGLSVTPAVKPALLSSASQSRYRSFTDIVLCYGRPLAVTGQLIEVQTCFTERDCFLPALEETITRAELRDQAWARHDWEGYPGVFSPDPGVQVTAGSLGMPSAPLSWPGRSAPCQWCRMAVMRRCGSFTTPWSSPPWPGTDSLKSRTSTWWRTWSRTWLGTGASS